MFHPGAWGIPYGHIVIVNLMRSGTNESTQMVVLNSWVRRLDRVLDMRLDMVRYQLLHQQTLNPLMWDKLFVKVSCSLWGPHSFQGHIHFRATHEF